MQLVDDRISMLDPMKLQTLSYDAVEAKFGVSADKGRGRAGAGRRFD